MKISALHLNAVGLCAVASLATFAYAVAPARAWGPRAHHLINGLAAQTLPRSMPAFMRTRSSIDAITYLGLELDLLKGSGSEWDGAEDPGHYLDITDNGTIEGGLRLDALPVTREAYDSALRKSGYDEYRAGFLPYSIVGGWEQLRMDFAYWRVDHYEVAHAPTRSLRAIAAERASIDENAIVRDAGVWGHYVADASQPLHVTVHFNGWGKYPNPWGYSNSPHLHDLFETDFVNRYVRVPDVLSKMTAVPEPPARGLIGDPALFKSVEAYLAASNATVPELYEIEKTGGFRNDSARARTFVSGRIAFGASELRTLVVWAWDDSLNEVIGDDFPQHVRDIVTGRAVYRGLQKN